MVLVVDLDAGLFTIPSHQETIESEKEAEDDDHDLGRHTQVLPPGPFAKKRDGDKYPQYSQ
jgi:hypothetical protein